MKRWLRLAASFAILLGAIYLLDSHALRSAFQKLSVAGLASAFLVTMMQFIVLGWRWYLIVQRVAPKSLLEHLKHYLVATFLNSFTPANLAGDVYRIVLLRSGAPGPPPVVCAVLQERFLGLLAYLVACVVLLVLTAVCEQALPGTFPPELLIAGIAAAFGLIALLVSSAFLSGPLLKIKALHRRPHLHETVKLLQRATAVRPVKTFLILVAYSALGIALWISAVKLVAVDLELAVSWQALGAVVVLTELMRMLPITIQGIGLREATFAYLLSLLGGQPESGFVLGAISYVILSCALLGCGLMGWLSGAKSRK